MRDAALESEAAVGVGRERARADVLRERATSALLRAEPHEPERHPDEALVERRLGQRDWFRRRRLGQPDDADVVRQRVRIEVGVSLAVGDLDEGALLRPWVGAEIDGVRRHLIDAVARGRDDVARDQEPRAHDLTAEEKGHDRRVLVVAGTARDCLLDRAEPLAGRIGTRSVGGACRQRERRGDERARAERPSNPTAVLRIPVFTGTRSRVESHLTTVRSRYAASHQVARNSRTTCATWVEDRRMPAIFLKSNLKSTDATWIGGNCSAFRSSHLAPPTSDADIGLSPT